MAQSSYRVRSLGDYVVGKQIGSGSYSVVWHARHKVHGTEVAIKEILTGRLNKKLEECLMSEIDIMKNINHPNIIRLHDMIKEPGKIYLVLEYCKGGDLSMFIHRRQGRIPESTAVHFMQQLAAGLKILRENQIIHRDLKPQNLLLSTNDGNSTLKIADFGFARSLQPRGLAETLCGSPLYMAPEIMNLQKYDAKADLWSVGAILFQIVTGRTPFTGINQVQLLQNIMKSTELQFPPNVKDLSSDCIDLCQKLLRQKPVERLTFEGFFSHPFLTRQPLEFSRQARVHHSSNLAFNEQQSSHEDDLPFSLDDDSSGPDGNPTFIRPSALRSTHGAIKQSEEYLKDSLRSMSPTHVNITSNVVDSLELIDQDYVLVSGPMGDASCSSASVSKLRQLASKSATNRDIHSITSAPFGASVDLKDASEQSSSGLMATIKSLMNCASAIAELVNEKTEAGQQLEAFSIQLVILAIWKQALQICHTQAVEGSMRLKDMCLHIERIFLGEVEKAEELAKVIDPGDVGMPDAMETIFQAALAFGKHGAVDECMGYVENAAASYSKAVCLLSFLVVEAPSLILNPPFSITKSDACRLTTYIHVLNDRHKYSTSQRLALLNGDDDPLHM